MTQYSLKSSMMIFCVSVICYYTVSFSLDPFPIENPVKLFSFVSWYRFFFNGCLSLSHTDKRVFTLIGQTLASEDKKIIDYYYYHSTSF